MLGAASATKVVSPSGSVGGRAAASRLVGGSHAVTEKRVLNNEDKKGTHVNWEQKGNKKGTRGRM